MNDIPTGNYVVFYVPRFSVSRLVHVPLRA
jgi:hypothetical protein